MSINILNSFLLPFCLTGSNVLGNLEVLLVFASAENKFPGINVMADAIAVALINCLLFTYLPFFIIEIIELHIEFVITH